jgi:dihydroorotate dehydrogenase electron transfer subunit
VPKQRTVTISDNREATPRLRWLTLAAPDLAREVRAGHSLLVRCDEPDGEAHLLRRALFVAASEPALGQVGLLFDPDEPGLAWLARRHPGDQLDVIGPLGRPIVPAPTTGSLLLVGAGRGLPALLLLAREATARSAAVTLLAGAIHRDALPPPFLLPSAIEYQSVVGMPVANVRLSGAGAQATTLEGAIRWADQLFVALPADALEPLRERVRSARMRWDRGFAQVVADVPLACGSGACGVCAVTLRKGVRLACVDGPAFDLRDML